MFNGNKQKKTVLVIAGHDPSGGAGIQADIESIANAGCHAATVITSLTTQNTQEVVEVIPQKPGSFRKQIQLILDDMDIRTCKVGLFGDDTLIEIVHEQLSKKTIPIILDPIICSGSGTVFASRKTCEKIIAFLLPITTIITPNSLEARMLSNSNELPVAAEKLLRFGAQNVFITGTHENTKNVLNTFYPKNKPAVEYRWRRLKNTFHGSGCTLSSRIAAQLALGKDIKSALEEAQEYTWNTLNYGLKLGHDQRHPNRFYDQDT